jgi:hypothetical protein
MKSKLVSLLLLLVRLLLVSLAYGNSNRAPTEPLILPRTMRSSHFHPSDSHLWEAPGAELKGGTQGPAPPPNGPVSLEDLYHARVLLRVIKY